VDHRSEVRDFLVSRRARITPGQAGLPFFGGHRRVPGLRREEVALLAGVSAEYYARLERGNLHGASDSVLEALARALRLDEAERAHLFNLARTANATAGARRRPAPQRIRPSLQQLLDAMTGTAARVRNGRLDYLAANRLGHALFAEMFESPGRGNSARFVFLDPRSGDFYPDWDGAASDLVAVLRAEAGRAPRDKGLTSLVGELSTCSEEFRARWAAHNVRQHRTGVKQVRHSVAGPIDLAYEGMDLTADPGLTLNVFFAEPGSASADALSLLASWAATHDQAPGGHEQAAGTRRP
jgi:transcriptional regulator with XRE-family HTH domain